LFVCDDKMTTVLLAQRPSLFLGRTGGPCLVHGGAPVVIVGTDLVEVERRLRAGGLVCPCGAGRLGPWCQARRRSVRGVGVLRPRRARCGACRVTHVLLAVSGLLRRADAVEVVGVALTAKAAGQGHRRIAARLRLPASTVRGWLRAFSRDAEGIRAVFTALLAELDPLTGPIRPAGSVFADAVEVIGVVAAATRRRLGVVGAVSAWQLASAVSGGRLLCMAGSAGSINTSWLLGAAG
jgi:hypothetical protein